ncbi:hypothetical protein ASZ90_019079 [hydrocarbon metagenome]|uniref:Uncharacterized protein n=1 Tax=hydrocarbon metagenome TaxID=938273 RepID=A0A0W8E507_9ZZZZ
MQYQKILLLLNITVLAMVYFFCKDKPKKLKLLISTTLYAYMLAVPLPYLLIWIPIKWITVFYVAAVGLSIILIEIILSSFEDIKLEKANHNTSDNPCLMQNESVVGSPRHPHEFLLNMQAALAYRDKKVNEADSPPQQLDILVETEAVRDEVMSEPEAAAIDVVDPPQPLDIIVETEAISETIMSEPKAVEPETAALDVIDPPQPLDIIVETEAISETLMSKLETVELEAETVKEADAPPQQLDILVDKEALTEEVISGPEAATVKEVDAPQKPPDIIVETEAVSEILMSEPKAVESEAETVIKILQVVESLQEDLPSIEQLIDDAFIAKCKEDYMTAITIFEQILRRRPSEDIKKLIVEDIYIMFDKIS